MFGHSLYPNNNTNNQQAKQVTPNIIASAVITSAATPYRPQTTGFLVNNGQNKQQQSMQQQQQQPFYQKRPTPNPRGNSTKLPEIAPQQQQQVQPGLNSQSQSHNLQNNLSSGPVSATNTSTLKRPLAGNSQSLASTSGIQQPNQSTAQTTSTQPSSNSSGTTSTGQLHANSSEFNEIASTEKDERFRYLLKHGTLKRIENNGNIIFCELPQILGVWVCYRRPCERDSNLEKLNLDYMELSHMPLLEGEEKLKILTYQHNKVSKIENLVSLPFLLYLDLYDNQVKEIESLQTLLQLRVLLLPKNLLSRITGLDALQRLEVLDLHSNKIHKIEGVKSLVSLKILNLANNLITKIEGIDTLTNLVELNLKLNLIEKIEGVANLARIEKLFLQNNKIDSLDGVRHFKQLHALAEINLEGNPVHKVTQPEFYYKTLLASAPNLKALDHKQVDVVKDKLKSAAENKQEPLFEEQKKPNVQSTATATTVQTALQSSSGAPTNAASSQSTNQQGAGSGKITHANEDCEEDINPEEVISIIGEQWSRELQRVRGLELQNAKKKEYLSNILVEGGHAEIEDDTSLFIYGNAYEIVLSNEQFQEIIERISFQYIVFDFIIEPQTLATLKSFKKLREITLKDNYLVTLLQLAKLEILPQLRSLHLLSNPLQKCSFLKEFIVYRFPLISRVNNVDIKELDKSKAKALFSNFDKILQLPEKFYNHDTIRHYPCDVESLAAASGATPAAADKQYMKLFSKVATETAETFTNSIFAQFNVSAPPSTKSPSILNSGGVAPADMFSQLFDDYLLTLIQKEVLPIQQKIQQNNRKLLY